MPKKEYKVVGAIFKNDYGWNVKVDKGKLPDGDLNLFVSPPHPDYVKDTSPEYFIKIQKDGVSDEPRDEPEQQDEDDVPL